MRVIILLAVWQLLFFVEFAKCRDCLVTIGDGYHASGVYNVTHANGTGYCSYLGIPYARPPVDELRFEPPQPWIQNASESRVEYTELSDICPQRRWRIGYLGSEDCLYLNVYTPIQLTATKPPTSLLPVFLWIHGGSYNLGSSSSDVNGPQPIIERDVIVVTVNYRLGPLGFLSMPEANITGNNGLKDQQLAMRWVSENIASFGGDRNAITLVGWSAGSSSVSFHLYTESSRGLFSRAILMSGVMNNHWAYFDYPRFCNALLFQNLNVTEYKYETIKSVLKSLEAHRFLQRHESFEGFGFNQSCFIPTWESVDNFLVDQPSKLLQSTPPNDVPIMVGCTVLEVEDLINHIILDGTFAQIPNFP